MYRNRLLMRFETCARGLAARESGRKKGRTPSFLETISRKKRQMVARRSQVDISSAVRFDRSERPIERGIWRNRYPCYGRVLRVAGRWFGGLFGPFRGRFGSQICYFWFICGKQFTSTVSKSPSVSLTKQLNWVIFRYEVGYFQFEAGYFCVLSGLFLGMSWISPCCVHLYVFVFI